MTTPMEHPSAEPMCPIHPQNEAPLRCIRCGRPMCTQCVVRTSVGYICRECARKSDDKFFQGTNNDYLIQFGALALGSAIINALLLMFGGLLGGFFMWIIALAVGSAAGMWLARTVRQLTGRRVGRYSPQIAIAGVLVGAIFSPTIFALLRFGVFIFIPEAVLQNLPLILCAAVMAGTVWSNFKRRI